MFCRGWSPTDSFGWPSGPIVSGPANLVPIGAIACRKERSPSGNVTAVNVGFSPYRGVRTRRKRSSVSVTTVIGSSFVSSTAQ